MGIQRKTKPTILSVDSNTHKEKNYFKIRRKNFGIIFKIRRMPQNDILAVIGNQHICVVSYNESDSDFEMFHIFDNLHSGLITDAAFSGDRLFSCCPEDGYVHEICMRNQEKYRRDYEKEMVKIEAHDKKKLKRRTTFFEKIDPEEGDE